MHSGVTSTIPFFRIIILFKSSLQAFALWAATFFFLHKLIEFTQSSDKEPIRFYCILRKRVDG